MRIGISVSSSHPGSDVRTSAANMIARARAANQAGLDSLFVGDHHALPSPYFQNTPMLGRMLAEWGEQPFGALYLLPLWHPVIVAEQVSTLATLAPGRFVLQCGLGDHRQGNALGIDMRRRVPMFEASLNVVQALWRGEAVTEERFWNLRDVRIAPLPPEPLEVWIGSVALPAIERTARMGDGWLASPGLTPPQARDSLNRYRQACAEHAREPTSIAIRRDVLIASDSERARALGAPYVERGYRGIDPDALLIGSVDEVAQRIAALRDMGYTDVIVRNISADQTECLETIEHLAQVKSFLA